MGYKVPREQFDSWLKRCIRYRYIVGVDIGQAQDPTAVCVIEDARIPDVRPGQFISEETLPTRHSLSIRHLERLPLRMPYPDQANHVVRMMYTAPLTQNTDLVVDATGVGRPVVDLFRKAGLKPIGITITGGDGHSYSRGGYRVAKLLLVSRLQALLHAGDIKIAADLPEAAALVSELQEFRATFTDAGNAAFGARIGRHDDLVLATAIAAWYATDGQGRVYTKRLRVMKG